MCVCVLCSTYVLCVYFSVYFYLCIFRGHRRWRCESWFPGVKPGGQCHFHPTDVIPDKQLLCWLADSNQEFLFHRAFIPNLVCLLQKYNVHTVHHILKWIIYVEDDPITEVCRNLTYRIGRHHGKKITKNSFDILIDELQCNGNSVKKAPLLRIAVTFFAWFVLTAPSFAITSQTTLQILLVVSIFNLGPGHDYDAYSTRFGSVL